jgi:hypothetical protein
MNISLNTTTVVAIALVTAISACKKKDPQTPPPTVKTCAQFDRGIAGCVNITMRADTVGTCEKPATDPKPQAWFINIRADTPVEGDRWNFTLKYTTTIKDQTGAILGSSSTELKQPTKKELVDQQNLLACRYASKSVVAPIPQYVVISADCIGFSTACDILKPKGFVAMEEKDSGPPLDE